MRMEKNKVGAGSWMVCDQTWEVGLYFVGKRKLWKVFDQGCDQFKAELWDGLSFTEVKADEREEGLGLRPPIRKGAASVFQRTWRKGLNTTGAETGVHGSERVCKREVWSLGPERHPSSTDASQASQGLSWEAQEP